MHGVAWLNDGRTVVAAYEDGSINAFDDRSGSLTWSLNVSTGPQSSTISCLASQTDDNEDLLFAGTSEGSLVTVSASERRVLGTDKLHSDEIRCVSSWRGVRNRSGPERTLLLTASSDSTVGLWSSQSGPGLGPSMARLGLLRGHSDKALSSAFVSVGNSSQNGEDSNPRLITSGADGNVILW